MTSSAGGRHGRHQKEPTTAWSWSRACAALGHDPGRGQRHAHGDKDGARAVVRDRNGQRVAVVTLFHTGPNTVTVHVRARELPPGFHGFHVHAIGICGPATGFTSAGGHLNPAGTAHDDHAGDLPVLLVNADGTAQATVATDRFSVDQLFDADGSAMVVHAAADNYANIPTRYHSHDANVFGPDPTTLTAGTPATGSPAAGSDDSEPSACAASGG